MATYVIREKCFGYNDEVFYVSGNRIKKVYHDQQEAEAVYKKLEIQAARNFPLYEVSSLFDASEEELQALDDFVFSRCGEHIIEDGCASEDVLPEALNPEDTFEFLKRADMYSYQLIQFDEEVKFYALWSVRQQDWLKEYDEYFTGLIYNAHAEELKEKTELIFNDYDGGDIVIQGAIAEITSNPILFQAVVDAQSGLKYVEKTQQLVVKAWNEEALFAINPLLIQPLFEIREISLSELQVIEQELAKEFGFDDEDDGDYSEDDFDEAAFEAEIDEILKELVAEFGDILDSENDAPETDTAVNEKPIHQENANQNFNDAAPKRKD